jgi:hypothetical protein
MIALTMDSAVDFLLISALASLEAEHTPEELWKILERLEFLLPVRNTCPDIPYLLIPPALAPPDTWEELLSSYRFPIGTRPRLLKGSFMPLDTARFNELTGGNSWIEPLTKRSFVPVDLDYGVVPFAENTPRWANVSFKKLALEQLKEIYPEVKRNGTLFFSLGALRMRRLLPDLARPSVDAPLTITVASRDELDRVLARIRTQLNGSAGYQMWFRGQNNDHLLEDFTDGSCLPVCPWRSSRDSALVPSLYRDLTRRLPDVRAYADFCREYALYSLFLQSSINAHEFQTRKPGESSEERLDEDWYRLYPQPTIAVSESGARALYMRSHGGDIDVGPGVTELHDYHPMFHGLQHVFFMQHYGLSSNVLDITYSPDVALFFAQNQFAHGKMKPVGPEHEPVLYVFLLRPGVDLFLNSQPLSEKFGLLRPVRQRCGLLFGASFVNRNDYARFIALKIVLRGQIDYDAQPEYFIPGPAEDDFLARLLAFAERKKFRHIKPWVYEP